MLTCLPGNAGCTGRHRRSALSLALSLPPLSPNHATQELTGGNPLHVRRRHGCGGVLFFIQILTSPIKEEL